MPKRLTGSASLSFRGTTPVVTVESSPQVVVPRFPGFLLVWPVRGDRTRARIMDPETGRRFVLDQSALTALFRLATEDEVAMLATEVEKKR